MSAEHWSGIVRPKGSSNCNNYRCEYWIMCATSRTMSAHFCFKEGKRQPHLQEKNNAITQ
ncbi:hypothetical protein F153LOC_01525 [Lelliottia sp. F153]|nr:hypothetical protein DAI21_12335 [Lelliottia sp. WB101]PKA31289.1 hypothetical protein CWR41_15890 [Cedecea lapagei]PLY45024.1 hypothetical protein F159LOC_12040 [Lelliottia sp. F159]PLY49938.1 hypothetical protein F154LOC_12870 [Lelliottia sp. F154]PLY55708.1 hypothetical protein F153LOC_01525 [Lelliottia sp. F153]RXJ11688.1 hypothetical protein ETG88_18010 [Lelliottia nimipressuralis]UQC71848.1 hypothetical protein C0560_14040 [Lelliottia sp. AC1]